MNVILMQSPKSTKRKTNKPSLKKGVIFTGPKKNSLKKKMKAPDEFDFRDKKGTSENIHPSSFFGFERG